MNTAERISKVIRKSFIRQAEEMKFNRPVVALSGGVDSCAVLASLMEVGLKPVIVSYTPSTHESTDFQMARQTAENLGLPFVPCIVSMSEANLDHLARVVINHGYHSKVQVESMTPMVEIGRAAKQVGGNVLLTGDQSDGYFCLSRWAAFAYDKYMGVPTEEIVYKVKDDATSDRIDGIRKRYYENDKSCSEAIRYVLADVFELNTLFPFRDKAIYNSFNGSMWKEINKPRVKEPIRLAFSDWFGKNKIWVRNIQVNLHKGDSHYGDDFAEILLGKYPQYNSGRGLYSAIHRGEV